MTSAICNTVFFVRSLALSQNPRLEHLLVSNRRAGQDLVVHQGFLSTLNPILDQDQSPGEFHFNIRVGEIAQVSRVHTLYAGIPWIPFLAWLVPRSWSDL